MDEENKRSKGNVFLSILLSSLLATVFSLYIEKGDAITTKSKISEHFQQLGHTEFNQKVNVVLEKEAGEQYLLLYTYNNQDKIKGIGMARYRKMNLLPLYELEHVNHSPQLSVGTEFLNNHQFIVYGNNEELDADYFTYRKKIEFKKVRLPEMDYFIRIETFENRFLVPGLNFYSNDGEIVASTLAK